MSLSLFVSMAAYVFIALAAGIPLSEAFTNYRFKKQIRIFVWIGLLIFGPWDIYNRFFESKGDSEALKGTVSTNGKSISSKIEKSGRKTIDSLKRIADSLESLHEDVNKGFKGIGNKNAHSYYAQIGWTGTYDGKNPALIKTNSGDSLTMKLTNYGIGKAFGFSITSFFIYIKNGVITKQTLPVLRQKDNHVVYYPTPANAGYEVHTSYHQSVIDSAFFCVKIDFSDSSKTRKSFNQILRLKNGYNFEPVSNDFYNMIENYLKKRKYWKPPFTQ